MSPCKDVFISLQALALFSNGMKQMRILRSFMALVPCQMIKLLQPLLSHAPKALCMFANYALLFLNSLSSTWGEVQVSLNKKRVPWEDKAQGTYSSLTHRCTDRTSSQPTLVHSPSRCYTWHRKLWTSVINNLRVLPKENNNGRAQQSTFIYWFNLYPTFFHGFRVTYNIIFAWLC